MKNIDDFDTVMLSWKSFEYAYGTSDQIRDCNEICEKIIDNYNKHMAIKAKAQKRKPEADGESKVVEKKQKTMDKSATNPFKSETKKPELKKVEIKGNEHKKPEVKAKPVEQVFGEKDDVSVFLSNLGFEVTKDQIIAAFPELNIKDVTLIVAPGGRSKGYGYAELSNPSEVEKALNFDRRPISGRPVFIKKVVRDKNTRPAFKYSESKELNKIFIKGLPFDTSKDELEVLFGTFGTIKDVRMVTKKYVDPFRRKKNEFCFFMNSNNSLSYVSGMENSKVSLS